MIDFKIIRATKDHIGIIASNMRQCDVLEIQAASSETPHNALRVAFQISAFAWTGLINNKPCLMFGVYRPTVLGEIGVPWLLATNEASKIKRKFITESRKYVNLMLELCPILVNYVDIRNEASIRWLKWLGFEILPAIQYGQGGELFHPFEMRCDDV